jgi:hypothetical protein
MGEVEVETRLAKFVHFADPGFAPGPVEVVINHGPRQDVKPGDTCLVFDIDPYLADSGMGEGFGKWKRVRGRSEAVHVQEPLATIRMLEHGQARPDWRIICEPARHRMSDCIGLTGTTDSSASVIEDRAFPETEVPFESVQRGGFAKPI